MPGAPLISTSDELLREHLLRLAAAAGLPVDLAHDAREALASWSAASLVLLGPDLAEVLAEHRPPRRAGVHLMTRSPAAPDLFRWALAVGAAEVVELPTADPWVVELLGDVADGGVGAAHTVAVSSGSGGVGATTLACGLAGTGVRHGRTVLVDLDPWGPGVDRVVGLEDDGGARWDALVDSPGRLGSRSVREALPRVDGLAVVTWAPGVPVTVPVEGAREVVAALRRGHDLVVVDLPRPLDAVAVDVVSRCDRVLVVADASVAGVASAARQVAVLRRHAPDLGVVVRVGRGRLPPEQVAAALGLPLLAEMGTQRRLGEDVDLGLGPVARTRSPIARACRHLLADWTGSRGAPPGAG